MLKKLIIIIIIMTSIWGLLAKSLVDNETIEEAITRLIAAHNDDETAHLGTGQALQSHKASEIIDHLASSIIADKISAREIENYHLYDMGVESHSLSLESIDGWDTTGGFTLVIGTAQLSTSNIINTWRYADAATYEGVNFARQILAQWRFRLSSASDNWSAVCVGDYDEAAPEGQGFGFKIVNGVLYAFVLSGPVEDSTEYATEITGIDVTTYHIYRVEYIPGVSVKFYVDDALKHTQTSNLPNTSWGGGGFCHLEIKNTAAANKYILISQVYFTAE